MAVCETLAVNDIVQKKHLRNDQGILWNKIAKTAGVSKNTHLPDKAWILAETFTWRLIDECKVWRPDCWRNIDLSETTSTLLRVWEEIKEHHEHQWEKNASKNFILFFGGGRRGKCSCQRGLNIAKGYSRKRNEKDSEQPLQLWTVLVLEVKSSQNSVARSWVNWTWRRDTGKTPYPPEAGSLDRQESEWI